MNNKKGFSFVETIVMCAILMVGLLVVYKSYTSSIYTQKNKLNYNNTDSIYTLLYLKNYLIDNDVITCLSFEKCPNMEAKLRKKTNDDGACRAAYNDCRNKIYSYANPGTSIEKPTCYDDCFDSPFSSNCSQCQIAAKTKCSNNLTICKSSYSSVEYKDLETYGVSNLKELYVTRCNIKSKDETFSNKNFKNVDLKNFLYSLEKCERDSSYRIVGHFFDDNLKKHSYAWIEYPN